MSIHSAKSINSGDSYKNVSSKLLKSASVPDAVIFKNKKLIYYVNGDFDNHSIYVAELSDDIKVVEKVMIGELEKINPFHDNNLSNWYYKLNE